VATGIALLVSEALNATLSPAHSRVAVVGVLKVYLGDNVYADYDGFTVVLTRSDGLHATNIIVLESEMVAAFLQFVTAFKDGDADEKRCDEARLADDAVRAR